MINKAIFVLDSEAFLQSRPMLLPLHSYDPPAYIPASVFILCTPDACTGLCLGLQFAQ